METIKLCSLINGFLRVMYFRVSMYDDIIVLVLWKKHMF